MTFHLLIKSQNNNGLFKLIESLTLMACIICLNTVKDEWSLQNDFYCCSARWCDECNSKITNSSCPQCRSTSVNDLVDLFASSSRFKISTKYDIVFSWHREDGCDHRDNDLPAAVTYNKDGYMCFRQWLKDGMIHRERDAPAIVYYDIMNKKASEHWFTEDVPHRDDDMPTDIYYINGIVNIEQWRNNDILHRDNDLPSYISYYGTGKLRLHAWYKHGVNHRADLPARINYNKDGFMQHEEWYTDGIRYKLTKYRERDGSIQSESWYDRDGLRQTFITYCEIDGMAHGTRKWESACNKCKCMCRCMCTCESRYKS